MKEKARKRPHPATPHRVLWAPSGQPTLEELVALEVSAALRALAYDDNRSFEEAAARVAERPEIVSWRRATERALLGHLQSAVSGSWRRGWQPDDLVRVARAG